MTETIPHYKAPTGNIGICGAPHTGKTTLAIALAERLNMPFVDIGTSAIFAAANLDPSQPMDIRTRLGIQRKILEYATNVWCSKFDSFICDFTPIDMMAYTLAEIQEHTLTPDLKRELDNYLFYCKEVTKELFSHLILIPPAIPIVEAIGKASTPKGYIDHIHSLCLSSFYDSLVSGYIIDRDVKELNARIEVVCNYLEVY